MCVLFRLAMFVSLLSRWMRSSCAYCGCDGQFSCLSEFPEFSENYFTGLIHFLIFAEPMFNFATYFYVFFFLDLNTHPNCSNQCFAYSLEICI